VYNIIIIYFIYEVINLAKKTNAGFTKRLESEKSMLKTNFKFNVGNKCKYIGGMHDAYKNCEGIIMDRSNKKHRIDYTVLFEDGNQIRCIMEKVLEPVVIIDDNVIESEEINND